MLDPKIFKIVFFKNFKRKGRELWKASLFMLLLKISIVEDLKEQTHEGMTNFLLKWLFLSKSKKAFQLFTFREENPIVDLFSRSQNPSQEPVLNMRKRTKVSDTLSIFGQTLVPGRIGFFSEKPTSQNGLFFTPGLAPYKKYFHRSKGKLSFYAWNATMFLFCQNYKLRKNVFVVFVRLKELFYWNLNQIRKNIDTFILSFSLRSAIYATAFYSEKSFSNIKKIQASFSSFLSLAFFWDYEEAKKPKKNPNLSETLKRTLHPKSK